MDDLQSVIDTATQLKETITGIVGGLSKTAKGAKGMAKEMAKEAIKKAKAEAKLKLEYAKKLIPLIGQEIEHEAIVTGFQTGLDMAKQGVQMAQDQLDKAKAEFESISKLMAKKNKKSQRGGEGASDSDKKAFDNAKKTLDNAQQGLDKAKTALKTAEDSLNEEKQILTAIQKEIAKIKVAMGAGVPSALQEHASPEVSTDASSSSAQESNQTDQNTTQNNTSTSTQNTQQDQHTQPAQQDSQPEEPTLTEEEIQEAKEMGEQDKATIEEEVNNMDPALEKMDAEWMVIENGLNVMQYLAAPLPQLQLPAFIGTGAPNTAFNMALSGCIGLLATFVLAEMNAAVVRWSALATENEVEPDAEKLGKIGAITGFKASLPGLCATGASYMSAAIAQV